MEHIKMNNVASAWLLLKLTYGAAFVFSGIDKFFQVVVYDWALYFSWWLKVLPLSITKTLWIIGIVQIVFGLLTLSRYTRVGALGLTVFFLASMINFIGMGNYYQTVVCFMFSMSTLALAQLSKE